MSSRCGRSEASATDRCEAKVCEPALPAGADNFPRRTALSGGMALQVFKSGTSVKFSFVRAAGPSRVRLFYSLNYPDAVMAQQVRLRICWDDPAAGKCAPVPSLAPTPSWDEISEVTVDLPAPEGGCRTRQVTLVADQLPPEPKLWGIQIDKLEIQPVP
jgi:hypothetical protein